MVVPFRGDAAERERLEQQLARIVLGDGDTLVLEQNAVSPGYGRNRGAERGHAEWLVFLDADVVPAPDLLDRYFEPEPGERVALLAGGLEDQPAGPGAPPAVRYAAMRGLMRHENTLGWDDWSFAQTANAACRREAFDAVGGFREDIRAGEDADLAYRIKAEGWHLERRDRARAVHLSRSTVRGLVRQRVQHGAGGAWLDREHPGSVPAKRWPGLVWWAVRRSATGLATGLRRRDRDEAMMALLEPLETLAYELGRFGHNRRA